MKIESILRRPGGTKVTLDGVDYHFQPDADGREIAVVTDPDHIGVFASIREGYRVVADDQATLPLEHPKRAPRHKPKDA